MTPDLAPPVVVAFFEQGAVGPDGGEPEPMAQVLTHAVPRERESMGVAGRVWKVAKVTWVPLAVDGQPVQLAATVVLWDPQTPPGPDEGQERRLKYADCLDDAIAQAVETRPKDAREDVPEGTIVLELSATFVGELARALRGIAPPEQEPTHDQDT